MAPKLSIELIQSEQKNYNSIKKVYPDSFAQYMNIKYCLNDTILEKEKDDGKAMLILLKDHAQAFE